MTLNINPNNLFKKEKNYQYSHRQIYDMVYLRKPFLDTLIEVKEYYRNNVMFLDSTNILAAILFNIDIDVNYTDKAYVQYATSRTDGLSRSLNITSSFHYGKIFHNEFYSSSEILLLDTRPFDIDIANKYWKNLAPVYPLLHPWSNLNYTLPIGGKLDTANNGLSVITINIPLLAYQFRCFIKDKMLHNDPINTLIPIFLTQYVLPNMLNKQIDLCILNILMNTYYNKSNSKPLVTNPFPLPVHNYLNKVITFSNNILNWIKGQTLLYPQILQGIPAVFENNMDEVLEMPNIANTRQVWWAIALARLDIMLFLISVGGNESLKYNSYYLREQQKDFSYLRSENIYSKMFDSEYAKIINNKIDYLVNL